VDFDLFAADDELFGLLAAHRRWLFARSRSQNDKHVAPSPLSTTALLHPERFAEVRESSEPLANALVPWLEVLLDERWAAEDRIRLEARRLQPVHVPHRDAPISLAGLVRGVLGGDSPGERMDDGDALARHAAELSVLTIEALEKRLDRAQGARFGDIAEVSRDLVIGSAEALLNRTDDVAEEAMRRGWVEGLHACMGARADRGWPARLTWRWVSSVFGGTGLGDGLQLSLPALPTAVAAASFARALSLLGVVMMRAGRPQHLPRSLHEHPFGHRRHRRAALFGGVVCSPRFAEAVLGLGSERAMDQSRMMAHAAVASWRVEAMRVLVGAALFDGRGAARERLDELSGRLFGSPMPLELLAVLPAIRPAHTGSFVGTLLAALDQARLVEAHDEDWFRNPRAIVELRQEDLAPRDDRTIDQTTVDQAVETLAQNVEQTLS
jgi:hypothetical protein